MMKRAANRFGAFASADTAAEASSSCSEKVHALSDAFVLASFFVILFSLRLCAVMAVCLMILALRGAVSSAEKEAEPVIVI